MFKLDLERAEESRDQIANICWIIEKARGFQKNVYFCFIDYAKAFVWITTNCGKLLKRWEYQTTLPASYMQVLYAYLYLYASQEATLIGRYGTTDWFQIGKGVCQRYCAYLTYIQSTSCKMPALMKHKLESRLPGEVSVTSDMQMTLPFWQKAKKNSRAS